MSRGLLGAEIDAHAAVLAMLEAAVGGEFARLVAVVVRAVADGNKIMLFGNGGSAADAQHIATELAVRYRRSRPAIAALALTTDTSALTAIGNDLGFDQLFARQIEALARRGDVVIGISTSGNSRNVLIGLETARRMGCVAAGLTGGNGGAMGRVSDPLLVVPSPVTARIQEMHILLGHALCEAIEGTLV